MEDGKREKEKIEEFEIPKVNKFYDMSLTITAFLGGITFTTMVVIMSTKEMFRYPLFLAYAGIEYSEFLISGLAIDSSLFILLTWAIMRGNIDFRKDNVTYNFANSTISVAFVGLLVLIPLLILPFSKIGTIVIVIIELIWFIRYIQIRCRVPKKR